MTVPADPNPGPGGSAPAFGRAVLAVVDGNAAELRALLARDPVLAKARSAAEHRSTLLHYVAANGVEDELQRTPPNAVEICELLLGAGADPDALNEGYGGGPNATTLCLLVSSWHPFERGVQADLVRALVAGGARVDGLRDDGAPLATALVFGYTRAAEALVDCCARVDNLYFAAGLGDVARVHTFFHDDGSVRGEALGTYAPPIAKPLAIENAVQEALHFAVTHGRGDVAELLLARGADVNGQVEGHHCRLPLLQALFVREFASARFLLERGADASLRDEKRGVTALEHVRRHGPPELLATLEG